LAKVFEERQIVCGLHTGEQAIDDPDATGRSDQGSVALNGPHWPPALSAAADPIDDSANRQFESGLLKPGIADIPGDLDRHCRARASAPETCSPTSWGLLAELGSSPTLTAEVRQYHRLSAQGGALARNLTGLLPSAPHPSCQESRMEAG
jgi:hypothetical protein